MFKKDDLIVSTIDHTTHLTKGKTYKVLAILHDGRVRIQSNAGNQVFVRSSAFTQTILCRMESYRNAT